MRARADPTDTRTLHALALPARFCDPMGAELRPEHDAVIELALLPFMYTLAGTVVEVLHAEAQGRAI